MNTKAEQNHIFNTLFSMNKSQSLNAFPKSSDETAYQKIRELPDTPELYWATDIKAKTIWLHDNGCSFSLWCSSCPRELRIPTDCFEDIRILVLREDFEPAMIDELIRLEKNGNKSFYPNVRTMNFTWDKENKQFLPKRKHLILLYPFQPTTNENTQLKIF